jgi:hypothetical protein
MYYGIAQHEYGPRPTHFWPSARGLGPMLGLRHLLTGSRSDGARPSPSSRGTSRKLTERRATLQVTGTAQLHWADHAAPSNTEPVFESGDAFELQRVGAGARSSRRMRRSVAATGKPGSPTSRRFRSGLTAISTSEPAATVRPSASIVQPINLPIRLRSPAGVVTSARNAQMPLYSSPRSSQRSN